MNEYLLSTDVVDLNLKSLVFHYFLLSGSLLTVNRCRSHLRSRRCGSLLMNVSMDSFDVHLCDSLLLHFDFQHFCFIMVGVLVFRVAAVSDGSLQVPRLKAHILLTTLFLPLIDLLSFRPRSSL